MRNIWTLEEIDTSGKVILIRAGLDVPVDNDGNIVDDRRIQLFLPTVKFLLRNKASKIIIIFHIGRPKKKDKRLSSNKVAERLSELLSEAVIKIDDWGEKGLPDEKIIVLENVRFNPDEKSDDIKKRDKFGRSLGSLADIFVMDAFSNMHHPKQASMTSIMKYLPSCIGLSAKKEIDIIQNTIKNPKRPLVSIIGGLKAEKLNAVHNLLKNVDKILICGALAFVIQKSMGFEMGKTRIDEEGLVSVKRIIGEIINNKKVVLPVDAIIADELSNKANTKIVGIDNIKKDWMAVDIGPKTLELFKDELSNAKTIIWNGTIGVFEIDKFANGTKEIANQLAKSKATVIVGGGDSAEVLKILKLEKKISFISRGGGASLTMFEGRELGVLKYLRENKKKFKRI